MPTFQCQTCQASFEIPDKVLARYPGWKPRFCKEHSPKSKQASTRGGSRRGGSRGGGGSRAVGGNKREENLTRAQVLAKYQDGPETGVFTDGSAVPNPGPGGWGFVWVDGGEIQGEGHGQEASTTNNRMELQALIEAYRRLPDEADVTLYSDSKLCVDTITQWAPNWERKGWKRKGGEIKNLELVKELLALHRAHKDCRLEWIAAHSGYRWNEYADSLATAWLRDEV